VPALAPGRRDDRTAPRERTQAASAETDDTKATALKSIVDDFKDLVTSRGDRASRRLRSRPQSPGRVEAGRDEDNHETDVLLGIKKLEARLTTVERAASLNEFAKQ
jgi:hypothetical protein